MFFSIEVYDGSKKLYSKSINSKRGYALMGFIASSVSIKQGNYIRNDEKGKQISFHSV
ncbi:hypothetical protein IY804_03865 [Campylobacter volucris]|uniref:hypothetical protein n=1 Tax=Campylobacter volucris TaxID=1031542 RepID=UPI00189F364F|nr:hypothetical protein [Campylobacter volucris]MBF7047215.1 hypothetical protein [Campylobacter volucris]